MQQQQHHHQLKLLQKMHQKKEESSVSGTPSECGSKGGHGSARGNQNRKETLTSKLQHHQSKLAKALMGQDGLMAPSSALLLSPLFKKGSNAFEHQLTSTEYDSSVRTDSGIIVLFFVALGNFCYVCFIYVF